MEAFKDTGLAQHIQRCQSRRAADRIGRQRATQKTISAAPLLLRIGQLQNLPFAHDRGHGIAAADHFAKQFSVAPAVAGADSPFITYTFDFTDAAKSPPKVAGLRVRVSRAPFVDGKGQITMDYLPPKPNPDARKESSP